MTVAAYVTAETGMTTARPEEQLLEVAIREHSRLLYRIAYSVLRSPADAEDAVQDVFLRLLHQGKKALEVQDLKAWLARIAWRVSVDRLRRAERMIARSEGVDNHEISQAEAADEILLEKERNNFLQQVIGALPEQLRDPLVLCALQELTPREVAIMLGISEAAVRSRAFRARQILRDRLGAWMGLRR